MDEHNPLLKIRFDGKAVGAGTIPVSHLLDFLSNMKKVLQRIGRVLQGDAESVRRGQPPRNIKEEVELDLVLLTHGSPAVVLGFDRNQAARSFPEMDFGLEVLKKALCGLATIQEGATETTLPAGYDTGVLMAWRDTGKLFSQDVTKIEFTLRQQAVPITAVFTSEDFRHIQERIKGPQTNVRTVEGRLLMADFKEHGTRCRVHPSAGDPVLCLFDEEQKEEVLEDILCFVRVVGEAQEDPASGKIASIKVQDIERLEGRDDEAVDLLPQGTPISRNFWESPTLEELARSQNVQVMTNAQGLLDTWPGEVNDGFEAAIEALRHASSEKSGQS